MNVFATYAIGAGLSVLVIAALILSLNSISGQWSDFLAEYEPRHVCASLQNAVNILHNPSNSSSALLARMEIQLPEKIGGSDYAIEFKENDIFIRSKTEYTCTVSGVELNGESRVNKIVLEFIAPDKVVLK
ncbi:MAG: hypothetical protein HZB65_02695 [Candidatus Aenigmarchaeota archaeon]|nr:hypothetical protein [Candidatus Aenigmarchaeota archaeon]